MSQASLDLAERVLGRLEGDGQVTVMRERSLHSRFARSAPTQATEVDALSVHVLSVVDGRTGASTAAAVDEDALRGAARRARSAAEAAARSGRGDYPGLPVPEPAAEHDGYDAGTAELDPALAGEALAGAFATAAEAGFEAYGLWTAGATELAIASTAGAHALDRVTDAYMKVVCRDAHGRSGWGAAAGRSIAAIDGAAVARAAASRVPRSEPLPVAPGAYPVVLDHDAVGALLEMLAGLAFNGLAHAEGRGALVGRLGTPVASSAVDLADTPRLPATLPRSFDFEGVPKAPVALIEGGVAQGVVHDTRSAFLAGDGARSTGHALGPGGSPEGPVPTNLVLGAGGADGVEGLAAPIERGLLVTRLWYLNAVHERSALLTGVTRDGTFWIEDGRIAAPARDVRFTDSALRILEATEALSAEQRLVSEADFYGSRFAFGTVCPALRADGFRVSGGA